jgi:hypothetical protein
MVKIVNKSPKNLVQKMSKNSLGVFLKNRRGVFWKNRTQKIQKGYGAISLYGAKLFYGEIDLF